MDFPVCPACRQSVIDDDAVDCPFCGASMKSKPVTKPVSAAASPVAAANPVAAGSKPVAKKSVPGKPTLPGDDFPFDVELTAGKSAIPAMPNPTKQRSLKVVCPMCDTPGYLPPTAAGQEVRCANAKCVMPVFTAPKPKKVEVAAPSQPAESSNLLLVGIMTAALMAVIGGGLYFFYMIPSNSNATGPKQLTEEDKKLLAESFGGSKKSAASNSQPNPLAIDPKKTPAADPSETAPAAKDELIKDALKQMKESSLEKNKQRSKPYCRQLAAEANAVIGDAVAAREHLEQLLKVGNDVRYYRIIPLLDLFWVEFATGDKAASAKTLNAAVSEVPKIPKFGRTRQEIAGRLAAALVAAGRSTEASSLLADFYSSDADAQFAARLQIATDGKVTRLSDSYSVLPWKFPQSVAVTASLISRGQLESAYKWAANQSSDDGIAECLSLWAEEIAFRKAAAGTPDAGGEIAAAVERLPPAFAARIWARAGCGRLMAKDPTGVNAAIKLAEEKLAQISVLAECKMPTIKLTDRFKLPTAAPLLQAATAACELSFLQAQSSSTLAGAESSLDLAMRFVDATAPSMAVSQQRQDEAERLGVFGLRKLLKEELKTKTDDEARTAASNYKRALGEIFEASQRRFELETLLLSRLSAAGVGLSSKVWIIVSSRAQSEDVNLRDNFFTTPLIGELREALKGTSEEKAIMGEWRRQFGETTLPRPVAIEFSELLEKDPSIAVGFIQSVDIKPNRRDEMLLQAASRMAATNRLPIAFRLIARLDDNDIVVREDCYRFAAALAAQRGQPDAVWKQVGQVIQQTEKVALCRGLIAGLQAAGKPIDEFPESASRH